MTAILLVECLALGTLLVCSAFFSSAETALFSLNPIQIHRIGRSRPKSARVIEDLLARPTHLLSTILIGNTLVNVSASALAFAVAERLFPGRGVLVAIPCMTIALLLFGEVTPKRLAMSHPERLAELYARTLAVLTRVLTPLRLGLEWISGLLSKEVAARRNGLTEDEFLTVVEVGEEEGVLDEEERTMVDGIIRLEETQVSEVMTPRVDLIGIDLDDPSEEHERIASQARFRYLPVYRGSLDQAEGFLDVPRYLLADKPIVTAATIPAFMVPETMPLDGLLALFQKEHKRVAFALDEYGGTAGLVTRGDILEEITADVDNEYGEARVTIQKLGENRWHVDGSTSMEDVNYELDANLEAEGADRIAGWVTAVAEHLPRTGEVIEAQGYRAVVQRMRKHRVVLILLEKLPPENIEKETP